MNSHNLNSDNSIAPLTRIDRNIMHNGRIVDFYEDTIKNPYGHISYYDHIEHKGAVAVLPILDDGKVVLVKQWRNSINRYNLEIPAGEIEQKDASILESARRELEEEAGYTSNNIIHLINIYTTPAFSNERIYIYLATDLISTRQQLDENEFIDVLYFTMEEVIALIKEGILDDSKTISAIMTYNSILNLKI